MDSGGGYGLGEAAARFLIGGTVVSLFSLAGLVFRPKSFAGLFGAAPSVAIATLALTLVKHPRAYSAAEGEAMIAGAVALCAYSQLSAYLMLRRRWGATAATVASMALWFAVAFGLWAALLRR